uniref:Venom peroxidase 1 n=1 Tax=Oncocephalus sp. TaxID=2944721 RepID=A0AB38ZET2_9HEMI
MLQLPERILMLLIVAISAASTSYNDFGYQPLHNFSGYLDDFQFSSPVSFTHSQRVYHPVQRSYGGPNFTPPGRNRGNGNRNGFRGNRRGPRVQESQRFYLNNELIPFYQQFQNFFKPNIPQIFQPPQQICQQQPVFGPCKSSKYRTIDGSCNNLRNPGQGIPRTTYNRLIPAKYSDGIHRPPISYTGSDLPSARLVSLVLFPERVIPDPVWTLVSMQWGQIITHDMSMAMGNTQAKLISSQCCSPDGTLFTSRGVAPPACFPIEIPADDPFYSKFGQRCMNFMRTTTNADRGCAPVHNQHQPREQLVAVSQYMDASLVYGSSMDVANSLREGVGGRLLVSVRHGRQWPPSANNKSATCDNQDDDEPCYKFGDVRGNQNPQLTVLQIILLREHNRVADVLHHLNPHWDDELIYQEARKIVIAEYQHINYYEWLPIFLGTKNMLKYGLIYNSEGYVDDYREDIDPRVLNGHATAAFRYFHSAIQGQLQLIGEQRSIHGALRLSDYFNRPSVLEEGDNLDQLTRGMATQNQENVDPFFTTEITNYLFRNHMPFGQDLRAIDIQRGRDHGLASYNDYRHFCGLPKAQKFEDFGDYISPENIEKLRLLYQHPDDVDLVVGGSLESHVEDTLSGPTYLCIMLEQFYRTRTGDRYFYENGNQDGAFTPEQLREIKKASVSRLFCDNGDNIQVMQPEGFRVLGPKNQLVPCENTDVIPAIDLSYWTDHQQTRNNQPFSFDFNFFKKKK